MPADPSLLVRARLAVESWIRYLLPPIPVSGFASAGDPALPVEPEYDQRSAMSALATHPWVRACARAKADDIGGLPIVVVAGRAGTDQVDDHPIFDLFRQPAPGVSWVVLLRQLVVDFVLTGNAYLWLRAVSDGYELHRLHPEHTRAIMTPSGVIVGWQYGAATKLRPTEVWHVRDASWTGELAAIYGESPLRPLAPGLAAIRSARGFATRQAGRGRPDVVITYPVNASFGPAGLKEAVQSYRTAMQDGAGVVAFAHGATVSTTSWTSKDVDFEGLDDRVRDETLAVMRVPPTRAGVPQANYAVAKAELRDYWGSLVSGELALFAEALTGIARQVGGSYAARVRFDTSAVEALQTSYDQRQARAGFWVTVMGATPADAARYEGFRDAPVGNVPGGQDASRPAREVDDQPSRQAALPAPAAAAIVRWWLEAAPRVSLGESDVADEVRVLAAVLEGADPDADALAAAVAPLLVEVARQAHSEARPVTAAWASRIAGDLVALHRGHHHSPYAIPVAK